MVFRVSFKAGIKQSLVAARYFSTSAAGAIDAIITSLTARQYLIGLPDGAGLRLRIWSKGEFRDEEMHELLDWLNGVHRDIGLLHQQTWKEADLPGLLKDWFTFRLQGASFFLEQLGSEAEAQPETDPVLSIGVLGGHAVMLSTNTVMFSELEQGVFGLSIAHHGSYLLERTAGAGGGMA